MESETLPSRAQREIRRRIAALPGRYCRWETIPRPDGKMDAILLVIARWKDGGGGDIQPAWAGFPVGVGLFPSGIEVACGEWHSHGWELDLWQDEEALCADFGRFLVALLSPATRLAVAVRRGKARSWRLELRGEGGWTPLEAVVSFHLPWGRKEIVYLQNRLLPPPPAAEAWTPSPLLWRGMLRPPAAGREDSSRRAGLARTGKGGAGGEGRTAGTGGEAGRNGG